MKNKQTNRSRVKVKNKIKTFLVFVAVVVLSVCVFYNTSYASWVEDEDGMKYIQEDGRYAIGFLDIEEKRYYFDSDGHLVYGKFYVEQEECYYYSNEEGVVQTGAIITEDNFFIADQTGRLATGFAEYDGQRYYFNQIAEVVVGWFKHEDNWYYSDSTGKVMTGFVTVDGYRYYLNPDGTRVKEAILQIDGSTYIFNADGSVDENGTTLYPVFEYMNSVREEKGASALRLNDKVQACAILRASNLIDGFSIDKAMPIEQLLTNRGVNCNGGYEFAFGGLEQYDIQRLMADMQKDVRFLDVLMNADITDVGIGFCEQAGIYYYDIIFTVQTD